MDSSLNYVEALCFYFGTKTHEEVFKFPSPLRRGSNPGGGPWAESNVVSENEGWR